MRTRWLVLLIVVLAAMAGRAAGPDTYGAGVSLAETTPIARVIDRPADFEGKTVRVDGTVTAVCTMMGCWMALAPPDQAKGSTLMIKVDDGVIVFPVSAKGRRATAQGVIERVGGDHESREAAAEHGEGARWQLKATGAVVH
jgi:Domain of unknown function (DUF4920)